MKLKNYSTPSIRVMDLLAGQGVLIGSTDIQWTRKKEITYDQEDEWNQFDWEDEKDQPSNNYWL